MSYSLVKTAIDELEGQVPRLLDEGRNAEGRRFLVMSVAQGTGETRAFTSGHGRFLASLGKARFRSTDFEVSGCCEQLNQRRRCSYVLSQGDFAPWNIRTLGSQLFVYDGAMRAPRRARLTMCCTTSSSSVRCTGVPSTRSSCSRQ